MGPCGVRRGRERVDVEEVLALLTGRRGDRALRLARGIALAVTAVSYCGGCMHHEPDVGPLLQERDGLCANRAIWPFAAPLRFTHLDSSLRLAAGEGKVEAVREMLASNASPTALDAHGRSAVWYAARGNHTQVVSLLIDTAVSRRPIQHGADALAVVASHGLKDDAKKLVDAGVSVDGPTRTGWTPLLESAQRGSMDSVRMLIGLGAAVNAQGTNNTSALMIAASRGDMQIAKLLLQHGACVDAFDDEGMTPLAFAVLYGKTEMAELLCEKGANPNHRIVAHRVPMSLLSLALCGRHWEAADVLIRNGARGFEEIDGASYPITGILAESGEGAAAIWLAMKLREREQVVERGVPDSDIKGGEQTGKGTVWGQ